MTNKCVFKAKKDIDEVLSPCFQINPDVQFKEVPTNGEEYLLQVMKERQNCTEVTNCIIDRPKLNKNQSFFLKEIPHVQGPDKLKPTIEWQNIQVADFSDVRMYISRMLAKKSLWPRNIEQIKIYNNSPAWWRNFFDEREPTLSCLVGLSNTLLDEGLDELSDIIMEDIGKKKFMDHKTGQWIYAFLACIRQPLLTSTIGMIRELARRCALMRSRLDPDDPNSISSAAPLNIFICIIARYFRQDDLAD